MQFDSKFDRIFRDYLFCFSGDDDAESDDGVFKLLNDEMNKKDINSGERSPVDKKPPKWQCIHLTIFELDGLRLLCEKLRSWSHAKLNYPKSFNDDSMELLDRLQVYEINKMVAHSHSIFLEIIYQR